MYERQCEDEFQDEFERSRKIKCRYIRSRISASKSLSARANECDRMIASSNAESKRMYDECAMTTYE